MRQQDGAGETPQVYIANQRLYLTADLQRVVEHGSPDAAFLLVSEGGKVSEKAVERFGLKEEQVERRNVATATAQRGPYFTYLNAYGEWEGDEG